MNGWKFLLIFLLAGLLSSCSEDDQTDPGIIPTEDLLNAKYSDTTTLQLFVLEDDTVRTDNARYGTLGSIYDPEFGRTKASFFSTINVAQKYENLGTNPVLDSIVLILRYRSTYGDGTKFNGYQVVEVMEVTEPIIPVSSDSTGYNSFSQLSVHPVPVASQGFAPKFVSLPNQGTALRVRLNNSFGQRFINADSITSNNVRTLLQGIQVRIASYLSQSAGQGGIIQFDLLSDISRIAIYFHNDENPGGLEMKLLTTGSSNIRFNQFQHEYSSTATTELINQLNSATPINSSRFFIQSGQGIRARVAFPHLKNYISDGKVIVNKAELIIPADEMQDYALYPAPANLITYTLNEDGTYNLTDDFQFAYYDSYYDNVNKQYRIVISQHIQQVLEGNYETDELYLDVPLLSKNTDVNRAVLHSPSHPVRKMKLHLVYTPVQNQ